MDTAAVDIPALLLAIAISAVVTGALALANRGGGENDRRGWITAGVLALLLVAVGLADLLRETPRETYIGTPLIGVALPILGATGMIRATRRVRPWLRWLVVFFTTFVLLLGGLLLGATVLPKYLPT